MSSTSLSNKQWDSTWDGLPREIRLLILKALVQDGCRLSRFATVSREWQTELERHNFARIKLTPSRLVDFDSITYRNRAFISYIWFCLELDEYDCTKCAPPTSALEDYGEALTISDTDHCPITTSFQNLFSALSRWGPGAGLILDISIYSPSDSKHWFKYLTFMPDTPLNPLDGRHSIDQIVSSKPVYNDPQHGWVDGFRHSAPPFTAVLKVFHSVMEEGPFDSDEAELQWWDRLPSVPAVTTLLLRQQNWRRWKPEALAHMFARFPRLQEVYYEPWREWDDMKRHTDKKYLYLFESIQHFNHNLKRLVVFENFNQQYPAIMQRFQFGVDLAKCESIRNPTPAVSWMVALASLNLEHLAASFIIDASHFFDNIEPSWEWPNLTSLVLTSNLLSPDESPIKIRAMLQAAAAVASQMPRLERMEIWNGRKGLAALFKYQVFHNTRQARITWRGTWNLVMESSIVQAWEVLLRQQDGWTFNLIQDLLDGAAIKSHGDAIRHLMLSGQVIRPISLQQIQIEQSALEGHGANVVINYVSSAAAAKAVAENARSFGIKAITIKADVSQGPEIIAIFQTAKAGFGSLDIVMSNSGIEHFGKLEQVTEEEIYRIFNVNVKAQFIVAQQAHKYLADSGRLILISSISAVMGIPNHALYSASKAAIQGMVKCLAWDFGKRNITVYCIAPGGVKTDMYAEAAANYLPGGDKMTIEEIDDKISV